MKINMIVLFVITAFLMISSFSKLSNVLGLIFANNYSIENAYLLIFLTIYLTIFLFSVVILSLYRSKGFVSNAVVKMTYAVFALYGLAMILPEVSHILVLDRKHVTL